jgi:hypothetical protein
MFFLLTVTLIDSFLPEGKTTIILGERVKPVHGPSKSMASNTHHHHASIFITHARTGTVSPLLLFHLQTETSAGEAAAEKRERGEMRRTRRGAFDAR